MAKYHVNPDTGEVGECSATKRCPFGDLQNDHYSTPDAARQAYEKANSTSTVAPAVKKVPAKRVLPKPVYVEETRELAAEKLSTQNSVEIKGAMLPVLGVKVGYKYAAVTVPDLKKGERVVNIPKEESVRATVRTETKESKNARNEAQKDLWTEEALAKSASLKGKVAEKLSKRVSEGYPVGASGIAELVEAEAQDRVMGELRARHAWVVENEPEVELKYNRAADLLAEDYKAEVLSDATRGSSGSSNAAYNLYDRATTAAKASFVRDGAWRLAF